MLLGKDYRKQLRLLREAVLTEIISCIIHVAPLRRMCLLSQLPYTQQHKEIEDELGVLAANTAVQQLRDNYNADLVMLIGHFPKSSSRGAA